MAKQEKAAVPAVVERPPLPEAIEAALVEGDLKGLSTEHRVLYYKHTCEAIGVNPMSKPFGYIVLNGKLTLYALKACTDQLREIHGISITEVKEEVQGDLYTVWATARDKTGRTDCDLGAVPLKNLVGENLANAKMKAVTKAKRRVTLSICGLGWLDETEVDSIPGAKPLAEDQLPQPIRRPRAVEVPSTAAASVARGIEDVKQGKVHDLGSFEDHADPPTPPQNTDDGDWPKVRRQFKIGDVALITRDQFKAFMVQARDTFGDAADEMVKDKLAKSDLLHHDEIPLAMYRGLMTWAATPALPKGAKPKVVVRRANGQRR